MPRTWYAARASFQGLYFPGPRCGIGQTGKQWIISPLLCSTGFSLAFFATEDGQAPPLDEEWQVNCGRQGLAGLDLGALRSHSEQSFRCLARQGWENRALELSIVPLIGRLRTDGLPGRTRRCD